MHSVTVRTSLCISLAFLALISTVTYGTATEQKIVYPTADSYVDLNQPTNNFGGLDSLYIRNSTFVLNISQITYLLFNLSSLPAGASIQSANLTIYVDHIGSTTQILSHFCSDTSWNELTINWNNAPVFSSTPLSIATIASDGVFKSFDVTSVTQTALSGSKRLTLVLTSEYKASITDYLKIPSREYFLPGGRPKLVITYTSPSPTPTPSGFLINLQTSPTDRGAIIFSGVNYHNGQTVLKANGTYEIGGTPGSDYQFARWETAGSISVANSFLPSTMCTVSGNGTLIMVQTSLTPTPTPTPTPSPRCVVATAAYGSELAPEVVYMRHVRDNMIGSNSIGRTLVDGWNSFYYSWSPHVAQFIDSNNVVKPVFRVLLLPLAGTIHLTASIYSILESVNVAFASVIAFLVAAFSSIGVYIMVPLFAFKAICRRRAC